MKFTHVPFLEALQDVSAGNVKIPQSEFRSTGPLAVVDQGQSPIAGYTADVSAAVKARGPVIVFGDHTRALKFVDFPFAMGADGVKVLSVREGFDPKFVYWYLRSRQLPSAGYSRHFKFLKEISVPTAPLDEQRRIAGILDHADSLRAKRHRQFMHLNQLKQAIFSEMFPANEFTSVAAGALMPQMRNGVSPSTGGAHSEQLLTLAAVTQGEFDPSAVKLGLFNVVPPQDKRVSRLDFLMCRGNGNRALVGTGTYSRDDRPDLVFPDTVIAGTIDADLVTMPFLEEAWRRREVRSQIEALARTTNGTYKINQQTLATITIPLPPLDLQREFGLRAEKVDGHRATIQRALDADDELFASLQSRAFRGEL